MTSLFMCSTPISSSMPLSTHKSFRDHCDVIGGRKLLVAEICNVHSLIRRSLFHHTSVKSQSASFQIMANTRANPKMNNSTKLKPSDKNEPTRMPRTFMKPLLGWSMLVVAITKVILAGQEQRTLLYLKPRAPADGFVLTLGKIVQDQHIFRQGFAIRSYEIGADQTASIETLMNYLQEAAINHMRSKWNPSDGFGSTQEMSKRDLIWVVTRIEVLVDCYPSWGENVEVDTWIVGSSGKNALRRDWLVRDRSTGQTLIAWVMMNKQTRKLSKIPKEVRKEIEPYFMKRNAILDEENRKLAKVDDRTAHHIQRGLSPQWSDLDRNQHVNNVKYIGWILKSTPNSILEKHELESITIEYKKECGRDSMLQSLTAVHKFSHVECQHLLRLDGGAEIMRARTGWRPKSPYWFNSVDQISAD